MPTSRLLIVIADRCPWHVLLIDAMSGRLKEQGIACGVVGLVEQGILSAPNIAGLRRLADKTGGAWDLANGRELVDAIKTLGLHLYHKVGSGIKLCEIVVLDHGQLSLFRDCVETGVRKLTDVLAEEKVATQLLLQWRTMPNSRLLSNASGPYDWSPPKLGQSTTPGLDESLARDHACQSVNRGSPGSLSMDASGSRQRLEPEIHPHAAIPPKRGMELIHSRSVDRLIRWGLWLSGGALLSALTLLTKK